MRSCDLPLAPTIRVVGCPLVKRIRVGMLMTSKRRASSGGLVYIDFGDLDRATLFDGDLLEDRGNHLAWAAPLGPEVDQDRLGGCADLLVEGVLGQVADGTSHGISLPSCLVLTWWRTGWTW